MKSRFKVSRMLIVAALLVGILTLPAEGGTQATESNGSLADTIAWLTSFLPTATGARGSVLVISQRIGSSNGCNLTILEHDSAGDTVIDSTYTFSLSDIDPSTVSVFQDGVAFAVNMKTRGQASVVREVVRGTVEFHYSDVSARDIADQASAQRVANAFQHAAQLCANTQPF